MAATDARPRVLFPLMLTLGVLLAAAFGGMNWYRQTQIHRELARDVAAAADVTWNAAVADAGVLNTAAVQSFSEDRRLSDAMLAKSRPHLLAAALPALDRLKQQSGGADLIIRDVNFVAVLRPAEPESFGDRANSEIAHKALATGRAASGLELTRGVATIRTIQPWKRDAQLLGYFEIGQPVTPLVQRLHQTLGDDAILLIDKSLADREQWEKANPAAKTMAWDGLGAEVITAHSFASVPAELIAVLPSQTRATTALLEFRASDRHFHGKSTPVCDASGAPIGRLVIIKDMTDLYADSLNTTLWIAGLSIAGAGAAGIFFMLIIRRLHRGLNGAQQRLTFDVRHDPLTTLNNRAHFIQHLDGVLRQATTSKERRFAVLYLDFDRFKIINDSLGHEIGDLLLQGIAARLRFSLAQAGTAGLSTVGRIGSDEFVVLLDPLADLAEAKRLADGLLCSLCKPFKLREHEVISTVSIGIATSDGNYTRGVDMIRDADVAMFHAKNSGRGRIVAFDQSMREKVLARIEAEHDLAFAVGRNELRLYYQPLVSFDDGKLVGFEALVRWQHPKRGFISPMDFIPVAEESGLILQIGNWVLEEGCRQLHNWRQGYPELDLTMSINLSRKQLAYPDLLERVERLLVANAIPASSLKLEITESTVMENGTASIGVLQAIRAMGVHLWMDDFGTGYSSLSCLHRFPLNGIKIDRAFIRNVSERRDYAAVVHAIVSLASNLGMHVVAEGVETEDQVALLKSLECHLGQGYLFSKPMDAKNAETFIQKYTPLSRAA